MPDIQLNQDYSLSVYFENSDGPITLVADLAVVVTNRASGATIASGTATESGSGFYFFTLNSALLTAPMRLKVTFTSVASELYAEMFVRVGDVPNWMRTRRQIRLAAARLLDGPLSCWDTEATSGTATTAVLPLLNWGGDDEYAGMWARFTEGANRGLDRRITAFNAAAQTITFSPALPAAIANGHRVELYKLPAAVYDDAISDAIREARDILYPVEEAVFTTDGVTTTFTLPSDIRWVSQVGVKKTTSGEFIGWLTPDRWQLRPPQQLFVAYQWRDVRDPFRWEAFGYSALPTGHTLIVQGMASHEPPLYDDSWVDLPPDYVIKATHAELARQRPAMADLWFYLDRKKEEARRRVFSNYRAGVQEVV